jgi:hypothetical protein
MNRLKLLVLSGLLTTAGGTAAFAAEMQMQQARPAPAPAPAPQHCILVRMFCENLADGAFIRVHIWGNGGSEMIAYQDGPFNPEGTNFCFTDALPADAYFTVSVMDDGPGGNGPQLEKSVEMSAQAMTDINCDDFSGTARERNDRRAKLRMLIQD